MDLHFQAFTFVDRIESVLPGRQIRGCYQIPTGIPSFPGALLGEAVGQLAAWSAMSAVEFRRRPVAGIAGRVEFLATARPGQLLELEAEIDSLDESAVAYHGTASIAGVPVLRLHECVGPMLPSAEFDDPDALAGHFVRLTAGGAPPGGFPGLPPLTLETDPEVAWPSRRARLAVPAEAPFFADHFPRRPIFPGSLTLHHALGLVRELAAAAPPPPGGETWVPTALVGMKLRAFVEPAEALEFEARWEGAEAASATVTLGIRRGGRAIGGAGIHLVPGSTN